MGVFLEKLHYGLEFVLHLADEAAAGDDVRQREFVYHASPQFVGDDGVLGFQPPGQVLDDFGLTRAGGADKQPVGFVLANQYGGELVYDLVSEQGRPGCAELLVVVNQQFFGRIDVASRVLSAGGSRDACLSGPRSSRNRGPASDGSGRVRHVFGPYGNIVRVVGVNGTSGVILH